MSPAVSYVPTTAAMIMIPAKIQCPTAWTVEYVGYLMTKHYTHHRSTFSSVDKDAQSILGGVGVSLVLPCSGNLQRLSLSSLRHTARADMCSLHQVKQCYDVHS